MNADLQMDLEPGFRRANNLNLPIISDNAVTTFITRSAAQIQKNDKSEDFHVDYVQIRKDAAVHEARGMVFPVLAAGDVHTFVRVGVKINLKSYEITETNCEQCIGKTACPHIMKFIFWLHCKSAEAKSLVVYEYWGNEAEEVLEIETTEPQRIRDLFASDDLRLECDIEASACSEADANALLQAVLDEMENSDQRESIFFQHNRSVTDEFDPVFIHHTLLDAASNIITDTRSFQQHMEDYSKQGLFERLSEVTRQSYKTPLWLEAQYMRLRCSLIHKISSRKDSTEDEDILDILFCKNREKNIEERQQLKIHKRFILKQTEKLENKTYNECGILVSDSYPYICATPDGMTDDHIVEIKVPKTEEEFEKYLEGRETIASKYMAQIQIQMYVANVTKALYCVLSPTFDTNGALHYVWVQADMEFVASLLGAAEDFWKDVVFPRLAQIYLNTT